METSTSSLITAAQNYGYFGIGALMFSNTALGFPPSEAICLAFGAAAARLGWNLPALIAIGVGANVIGTTILFLAARALGRDRVESVLHRLHQTRFAFMLIPLGLSRSPLIRVTWAFRRYGPWIVLIGRNIPLVRSVVSIPAGLSDMQLSLFLLYTSAGVGVWVTAWTTAGYYIGQNPGAPMSYLHAILVLLPLPVMVWTVMKFARRSFLGGS